MIDTCKANKPRSLRAQTAATALALAVLLSEVSCGPPAGVRTGTEQHRQAAVKQVQQLGGTVDNLYFFEVEYGWAYPVVTIGEQWKGDDNDLASVTRIEYIHQLWLDNESISERALQRLDAIRHLDALHCLATQLSDTSLQQLVAVEGLTCLDVSGKRLTDAGLAALAGRPLVWLYLRDAPQITDDGLRHLSESTELINLRLNNTKITGGGLASLAKLQQLRVLDLAGSPVDDQALRISRSCPACASWTCHAPRCKVRGWFT